MKLKIIFLCILGIIFFLSPIINLNSIKFAENISDSSELNEKDQTNLNIEGSAISSIPAIPMWSYDTSSRNKNIAISSNGQYIALACYDLNLYLFEKDNSTPIWTSNLGESVQSVAITPDGQYIVAGTTGRANSNIHFFDKNSSIPLWSCNTGGDVISLSISSNGHYIAAGIGRDNQGVLFL